MKTLYDIGDEIKIVLEGKVIEYSASEDGDCYTIELSDPKQRKNRVYFSSKNLEKSSFKKGLQTGIDFMSDFLN